jgi:hypothetical protein
LNATLPAERRIRVWLGDAPIDWDTVRCPVDVERFGVMKDRHAGELVKREVLAKGRKALVIFGDGHLQGRGFAPASLTNVLERPPNPVKVFAIAATTALASVDPGVTEWQVPSLARLRNTALGRQPYARFIRFHPRPAGRQSRSRISSTPSSILDLPRQTTPYSFPSHFARTTTTCAYDTAGSHSPEVPSPQQRPTL